MREVSGRVRPVRSHLIIVGEGEEEEGSVREREGRNQSAESGPVGQSSHCRQTPQP